MDRESLSEWAKDKPLSILQLDPADRAVLRIADERDAIQKKTFTKWVNKHLKKAKRQVDDLFEDLRDGHNLLTLLEVLSNEYLPREKGKMRFHMLQNAQMALDFLRYKKIKLVNIRAEDIVDGNPKLTLGLIWTIILHFQISDIVVGKDDNVSAREALLRWARRSTLRYPGVRVNDFTSSWRDGLAFSALVHRNRPDLLDWRKARTDRPRERLEHAFHIVEKEYGVTRLLDPEDVDTNEPDEKSLITYISSLYDVFPEPPSIHPLFDMESQRRVHEYRDLAHQFIYWCREKTAYLQERSIPPTVIEIKRLLNDLHCFRNEEVLARKNEKQKLIQIYNELERYFESVGEIDVESELRPETIEKVWYRMLSSLSDRELILQQELERLERMQRLADKVQRELKHIDVKISDLETVINEESRRIERLHPIDAKSVVESLETEIRHLEEPIQDMHQDCLVLNEGRYTHGAELLSKANKLHQRWTNLHAHFNSSLVQKLTELKYPVHETTVTRQTRTIIESRQIETNSNFRDLQDHIEWCQSKLKQLHAADYGSDLPSVKDEFRRQQEEHKNIEKFHSTILTDERQQTKFSGDELRLYLQRLNQLQKLYAELLSTSTKRLSDLDALQIFLAEASAELQWLNEKELVEITRDWSDKHLELTLVHRYYENLMTDLEKREIHFASILDRGEALLNQQHPASKCIEAHLTVLQQQWAWLLQLTLCLEVHLKHATEYHQFFTEIKDTEQWLNKRDEVLNSKYSQSDFSLDQGENLLRGMQDLREELNTFGEVVSNIQQRALSIIPLSKRRQSVNTPYTIQAICGYKLPGHIQIEKGEKCLLLDNSGRVKWRIRSSAGQEGSIPSACFLIPPPDKEAVDAADRLKRLFDRTVNLWQKKHLRLRQNMIFATIRVVKSWDFDQFLAMGSDQRSAIRRALNEDAEKLLSEGDSNDPQLRRLRREMDEVNRLFDEFEKRANAEEESKQSSRVFTEECITIKSKLEDMARELDQIILAPLPRDLDSVEHVQEIFLDYERRLKQLDPEIQHLQKIFRNIPLKTPALKKSLDNLLELWNELHTQSGLHKERLKLLEISLMGLEENENLISDIENKLATHMVLPSSHEGLQKVYKQLTDIQEQTSQHQPKIDKMNDAADQLGRMGVPTKVLGDLKSLHTNVGRLNTRWVTICNTVAERMRSCETVIGLMKNLQSSIQAEESWVDGQTEKLSAMPTATSAYELDKLLGAAEERKPKVENVNIEGGRLIREAKIYDGKCMRLLDWIQEVSPSFSVPRQDLPQNVKDSGAAKYFNQRLITLNTKYSRLLELLSQRLKTAIEVNGSKSLQYAESIQNPLKTFRADVQDCAPSEDDITDIQDNNDSSIVRSGYKSYYGEQHLTSFTNSRKSGADPDSILLRNIEGHGSEKHSSNGDVSQLFSSNWLDIVGIRDPRTGNNITVREAILMRILDVPSGEMILDDKRISLESATKQGFIDHNLCQYLLKLGASKDSGEKELSLLEINQSKIKGTYSRHESAEKRIKITSDAEENSTSPQNIIDFLPKKIVDIEPDKSISLPEAYNRGYLIKHESVTIKSSALCLSDAIAHGLVDASGWIADRNSGNKFRLDSAVKNQLIDPNIVEVVDAKNDIKISVSEALKIGILNSKTGHYLNEATKEKFTFIEARNRKLIVKPYTLKDIVDFNLLDKNEKINSPMRRSKLNLTEAVKSGVLDNNNLKCINKRKGELVTLEEAIKYGIILPAELKYRDFMTGEVMTIPEAVERGLISSVSQKSIFNIDGFKDIRRNDFVSFNMALTRNILCKRESGFALETSKNIYEALDIAVKKNMVRQEVYEMFTKKVGVYDASGNELTVLDLCYYNLIDPKTGYLLDPKIGKNVPLDIAIEKKFITPGGALFLSSLLNITLTTETVTRTVNRYVSIQTTALDKQEKISTFTEAVSEGLIDEDRRLYHDQKTGNVYSVQQALSYGLLIPDLDDCSPEINYDTKLTKISSTKNNTTVTDRLMQMQNYTEVKSNNQTDDSNTLKLELPPGGWLLRDAIDFGIFDANAGTLSIDNVCIPFNECIKRNVINNLSVSVIDPQTHEKLSIGSAIKRNIIDPCGNYKDNFNQTINIQSAINEGKIILEEVSTNVYPSSIRGAETVSLTPTKDKLLDCEHDSPDPLQIAPGEIYDPSTMLVIFTETGQSENILKAAIEGRIDENIIKIVDPHTNEEVYIKEAIRRKICDPNDGMILTNCGERTSFCEAMRIGLAKVCGTPLIPVEDALQTLRFVTDPRTGENIPLEVAYERGIVHRSTPSDAPITLLKIRKIILKPIDALQKGIIDNETKEILESLSNKDALPIRKALDIGLIDGRKGKILDPQRNRILNIHQAVAENVIDPESQNHILIPLAKSLSIPKLLEQGLIDLECQKIVHPDNGYLLNINEAITCDILDPLSVVQKPNNSTLQEAIKSGIVDGITSQFKVGNKVFNLSQAVEEGILDSSHNGSNNLPPVAMTFPVAVERGLINPNTYEITHPYTRQKMTIGEALANNLIMSIPYPPRVDAIEIERALNEGLIDVANQTVKHPKTEKILSIRDALEGGFLLLKPLSAFVATQKPLSTTKTMETIKSLHTVTTKTIELMQGYVLVSNNEVRNIQTGEICTFDKAKELGILTETFKQDDKTAMISEQVELVEKETLKVELSTEDLRNIPTLSESFAVEVNTSDKQKKFDSNESSIDIKCVGSVGNKEDKQEEDKLNEIYDQRDFVDNRNQILISSLTPDNNLHDVEDFPTCVPHHIKTTIGAAISQNLVDPWHCRVIIDGEELMDTMDILLENKKLFLLDEVQIHNNNLVTLERDSYSLNSQHQLTAAKMSEFNAFDLEHQYFMDPVTKRKISFQDLVLNGNVFNPEHILVKNFTTGEYEKIIDALDRPLLNRHNGHMVDPKTGKKVPFFECITRKWITYSYSEEKSKPSLIESVIDPETGKILLDDGRVCSINDAINNGNIDIHSLSVRDPVSGEIIPLRMAIELGVVNMESGTMTDIQTFHEIPLEEAFKLGFLVPGARKPISLEAAVRKGLYNKETGKLYDSESQNQVDIQRSIEIGLVDPKISLIVDSLDNKELNLHSAIEEELVETEKGQVKDTKSNIFMPLNEGVENHLVKTDSITWSLPELLQREYYSADSGKVFNPITGNEISLQQAIELGFVEIDTCLIKNEEYGTITTGKIAAKDGLLDTVTGVLRSPYLTLDEAFVKGYIISTKKPLSLVDCLVRNMFDPSTSTLKLDEKLFNLKEAIALKYINQDELIILNPETDSVVSIKEAISTGLLDPVGGYIVNPCTSIKMSLYEALENKMLLPPKRKRSLPDAVYHGLYDSESGKFSNTITREKLSTEAAIRRGIIDPYSTIVKMDKKLLPFMSAVEAGIVDTKKGTIKTGNGPELDFKEAFHCGTLVEVKTPISLGKAIITNIYNDSDGNIIDPKTGRELPLAMAIEAHLIDINNTQLKDYNTGLYTNINLVSAKITDVIDSDSGLLIYNNQKITVKHAFDVGILKDTQAPVSIQKAIIQGFFDECTGKIIDPTTGKKITLMEAMRNFVINPQLPCYFDELNEKMHNLNETCRLEIIDKRVGVFKERGSNTSISLEKALKKGLIVDIENAEFGLYETLAMGFYDASENRILHPLTGRKLNLSEACAEKIVSPTHSLIKNESTGKYMQLSHAFSEKLIDANGFYSLGGKHIDLASARERGLIVTSHRPLDLITVIRMKLYNSEKGTFCDPTTGEYYNLNDAICKGLINSKTTIFRSEMGDFDLKESINNGFIDIFKGEVLDPKTREFHNYDKAVSKGILIPVSNSLLINPERKTTSEQTSQKNDRTSPREMSLEEAISCNIFDPNTALVRQLPSHKLIPFSKARQINLINMSSRVIIDPKLSFLVYDPSIFIYLREPITFDQAVESKSLDLETGLLTYKIHHNDDYNENISGHDSASYLNRNNEVYSLKDAVTAGIIDPVSALVKDEAKAKFVGLSEAFRKGLMDAKRANVLNTKTSKSCSLRNAYETGLVITPKRSFGLIEAIQYKLYNPENGYLTDPFQTSYDIKHDFTILESIANGLLDPSSTVVRASITDEIVSLTAAINSGLIDGVNGRFVNHTDNKDNMDLIKAVQMNLILPAEQRQAVFEKFNTCEECVNEFLKWVSTIEYKISNVGGPKEKIDEIRNQTNILRQIKEEIDGQQRPVSSCLEQIRQIVLTGADVLSAPEVSTLENAGRELRSRVDRVSDRALRLLRRLESIRDELTKLCGELSIFFNWLQEARHTLEDKEQSLADLKNLSLHGDSIREFVSDVIGHQADLRFVTMSAQRFVDGSKEYLAILNDFRTALPERLPHIEPISNAESPIRQEVSLISTQYKDLLHRANALQDRISGLCGCQREFQNAIDKADEWIRNVQPRVARLIAEPISGDTKVASDQMNEAKALHNELLSNGRLLDSVDQTLEDLVKILGSQLSPSVSKNLEKPALELKAKYVNMLDTFGEHCKLLDKTLVQSQGVQDALENLVLWVNKAEDMFKLQFRPASLIKERLQEQIREHKTLLADVNSHQATISSVQTSAKHLMDSASNARIAKKVESNLKATTEKVDKLVEKLYKRGDFLENVYSQLQKCLDGIVCTERDLHNLQEIINSLDANNLPIDTLFSRTEEAIRQKESKTSAYENCVSSCKDLIGQRDVTDTSPLRDRIKSLENLWRSINITLDEKSKLSKLKAEQEVKYENMKEDVMSWLNQMEGLLNKMSPVAIDLKVIRQQHDELKPLIHKHRDFSVQIEKINDIGAQYDALLHPESPNRKKLTYSPSKGVSPLRATPGDRRSPSPNKGGVLSSLSTGRRSSQDGFQISEFSPVQQQLKEINNRFSLIGVRLTDRQNEIDNMTDEIRKQYENLKNLSLFLDRIQRQVPKEIASNKEEADHCIKQVRKVLEEMYEKQSLLDTTKVQIKDILRRKSGVTGADELRLENDNIIEKWKSLNDVCKRRIEFSEKLRDFLDIHNNLSNWLHSKERILTVLGPISTDSRMVQSQVQQVQVLREEFRIQQPQLNHFQEIGLDILNHISNPSEKANVEKKLKDILNKWEDLVSRLDDRANNLGGAVDSSKEFDDAVTRLREALQSISDNLDELPKDGDHQENLRQIENLDRQLEGQRSLLADAEQSAVLLCNILGDSASRNDVNSRVSALEKQYQALQRKLDTKKAETEASLRDSRHLSENCTKMLGWLSGELSNLSEKLLLSAHKPTLQHQIDTHEPIYREVMAREHEIIMLTNKGKELSDRQQHHSIKRDLERIQQLWDKLRREVSERHSRLQTGMEHCKKYSQMSETFLLWLRKAEDKLANLVPGKLYKSNMENSLRDIQTLRSEVWKHSNEYETTRGLGETFISYCDIDKDPIKCDLQDIKDRWERLNNDLITKTQDIENCSRRLSDFNDNLRSLDHAVGRCEDRLAAHDALGGAAKDPKLLERVKAIRDELMKLEKPLNELKSTAKTISLESSTAGGDTGHLSNEVDNMLDRVSDLKRRLSNRFDELQSAASTISKLNEEIKLFLSDLNNLEKEIENLSPPGREVNIVRSQLKDISDIQSKLEHMSNLVNGMERSSSSLIDSGITTENQIPAQISSIRKTLNRLDNQSRNHERNLENTLKALLEFFDVKARVLDDLKRVKQEFNNFKPVSSELDQIRRQQEDFRDFRNLEVDPLGQNISKVNNTGRDLVRSAGSGVSTAVIEKDLEVLNDSWNNLKELMNERERRLDVALLQSGRFQEALSGLSKWLFDTEEMVANQKPPSSDYKVVKAQLQEQKFLKKMLMDRQNSMSSLSLMGREVANVCEPSERDSIEEELNNLVKRFDSLTNGAEQRENDLEAAMEVAKAFHDKVTPLELWLDGVERSIKTMELVPTDEEKIQNRIKEHNALHGEILSKKTGFTNLADIAGQLMHLIGEDEAIQLGEKVRNITDRYTGLVDVSENIGALLAESRQGLRHLVITYQELVGWMERMEQELASFKLIPVYSEKLMEQMDHLVELNENIASQAPNIESTVDSGSELMKHISNDEALQLKDKLDALQRRYGQLATRGGDLLKKAKNALPLVQQFHDSHKRLLEWMQIAESSLSASELCQADILRLETELVEMRPVIDNINLFGPQLCQISPGEGSASIENIVMRDNRRFDAIVEQIQRKAERFHLSTQRVKEVTGDIDELLEWFRDMDATLREADPPAIEPTLVRLQLQEHRTINDDISSQKGRVRDVAASSKKILRESPQSEYIASLREKLEDLKEIVDSVAQLCGERLGILEQALPLSEHFADSHNGLSSWFDDMEQKMSRFSMPALRPDQITTQQDKNERLLLSITEHKPLLDKLNKTGEALTALVSDDDSAKINDFLDTDNARYAALRLELRERQQMLENALQESSQFSDKLEGMLRALANTVDQVNQLDPLSALPQKIREQMEDNASLTDDLDKRSDAFTAVKRAADEVIAKAGNKADPAVRDIKSKLEQLNSLWNDVQKATKNRGSSLDDILSVAEPFWEQLNGVMGTLKDLEETLSSQEPPAAQPQEIQKQQVALQEVRYKIDQTKPEVEQVRRNGSNLINMCGEPDKPEVKKHIDDLDNAWDSITALYAKREENLIDAMEKAMEFHETLQNLEKFLNKAERNFEGLGPVGSDIDVVKKQIVQLREFKDDVDPHMLEVEALNRQAIELTDRTSTEQAASIRKPLSIANQRWEALLRNMVERQKQLEHALLHLGQFQHALNELLVWIDKTDVTLDQLKSVPGDPQLLEVELAKLKVIANDIQAHRNSVDTLNDAGRQLIETEKGTIEASTTQDKLRKLNSKWKLLIQKASDRQHELEEALHEAQEYIAEVQDILGWLGDVDAVINASKPVGGLPETATEQLERFMEVYNELEENRPKVETIQVQGQEYIKRQNHIKVPSSNLQHTLRTLKQRWDAIISRASDKKIKLEIALKEASEFHDTLQAFVEWLDQAEKHLANAPPVSRVLRTIQDQMEEHKVLQKDVSTHREAMLLLDKKGTHLKYFSQKQDVILIKNLLVSVQHRWERIVSKSAERTRALDHGYKEAREYNDSWNSIMQYLHETDTILDQIIEDATKSKEPLRIKKLISKLKDVHRQLATKQTSYDATIRSGKSLLERAPKGDEATLVKMLTELKEKWTMVWSKSIERQRKMEEALLLSGQFSDALCELLDWLKKAKTRLNENGLVHGDLETVQALVEHHKHIEHDLQKRAAQMQGVLKTGRELEKSSDNKEVDRQLNELQILWEEVIEASKKRNGRLQEALKDAEKLNREIHSLFDWLDHAEQKLRYAKNAPDDEKITREMIAMHNDFTKDLENRKHQKAQTFQFADEIIYKAYPDAIPIIKNWLTIIQQRWDEVLQWSVNREAKLEQHLQSLKDLDDIIEELLVWLNGLEATLLNLEKETLPDEIIELEKLIEDHKEFMENTARRQVEVDRACKPKQQSSNSRRSVLRISKTPNFKGSRDQGLNTRRSNRLTPSRDTPDRDRLPHYGPRFSESVSSVAQDLEFRSPRASLLWDKWRYVWMLSWERQRRLHDHMMHLKDMERVRNFSWDDWRKRFLKYMNHKKSRLTDLFRKMDKDNNGLIPRSEFMDGILNTKFDTSRMEMSAVADLFDRNGEGLIDWQEFIAALRPDWQERKPVTDSDKIHDEVKRLVMLCTCRQKFRVFQVGEGKYRFGDSQKLRLVRILRSTVMVRVGGGWVALDEFLQKNDPCRAKGRTNIELREQFILADGVSQSMAAFTPRRSTPNASQASNVSPYITGQGPIIKVRERSVRSIPMSRPSRSSQSASTPDSLSDNEFGQTGAAGRYTPRKITSTGTRSVITPSGSRAGSKPNSRPLSRQGSKPPSRHGSNISLDSTDEIPPSRIPQRKSSTASGSGVVTRPSRLSVTSVAHDVGTTGRKTVSGSASPAQASSGGMSRASSIPRLSGYSYRKNTSGSSTPSGIRTPRKGSADPTISSTMRSQTQRGTTPVNKREPFRL
ncbi:microtubule-actin cross-linking factor 1 isoform X18 [Anastrepha ludens]|uniref:microtubule-actin cross-linking factor 1 isoform X18 n=1 Tax=Anastrepha ludens TaxID=28586 RepID=UPI0023AEDE67|nr:microtubule-actin cross-linking factor 1 isoform X18 [Anastrepha ludens]